MYVAARLGLGLATVTTGQPTVQRRRLRRPTVTVQHSS